MNLTTRILLTMVCLLAVGVQAGNWPAWNGPSGSGVTPETQLPLRWNATENVLWKVPLPDRGNSSPIVWGDRVFITQAIERENRLAVVCLNRANGKVLWQSGISHLEKAPTHDANPYGSASPVTDGERVIAWFGSAGILLLRPQWQGSFGVAIWETKSPVGLCSVASHLCRLVLFELRSRRRTFLIALDKKTGKTVWKVDVPAVQAKERTDGFAGQSNGVIGSWSTPVVIKTNGRDELIVSFPEQVRAFDPKTGKELWVCDGLNPLVYSSPIYGDGVVVAMGGFLGTLVAVKPGGNGNVPLRIAYGRERNKNQLGTE
jgi:outer membrane protein assembly factor BamB